MAQISEKTSEKGAKKAAKLSYPVLDMKGKEVGSLELDGTVFGAPVQTPVVFDAVMWQLSKRRQGTHSVLTKGAMKGGGKKPWKQKGTGRARAGTNRSPLWVGGGVAHGPKSNPFGYENRLSKRSKRQALAAALTDKINQKGLIILDSLAIPSGKTKDLSTVLSALGCLKEGSAARAVMLCSSADMKASITGGKASPEFMASRNVKGLQVLPVEGLNVFEIVKAKYLVGTKVQFLALQGEVAKRFSKENA